MPNISLVSVLICHKILTLLIYSIIGQVHHQVAQVTANRRDILFGSKSGQPFFIDEYAQWVYACDQHINSKVELQIIDQVRLMEITLGYVVLPWLDKVVSSGEKYSLALTHGFRFNYERFGPSGVKLFFKAFQVSWEHPSLGEKLIFIRVELLHSEQIFGQKVLSSQCIHAWEMVSSLVILHFDQ